MIGIRELLAPWSRAALEHVIDDKYRIADVDGFVIIGVAGFYTARISRVGIGTRTL